MKKHQKLATVLICLAMLSTACTTASPQEESKAPTEASNSTSSTVTDEEEPQEKVTIDVYSDRSWIGTWDGPVAERITEKTGIDVEIKIPVKDEDSESLSLMMASDDFPDALILNAGNQTIPALIDEGYLANVDNLISEHAPELKTIMDTQYGPEMLEDFRHEDGNNYLLYYGFQTEMIQEELTKMDLLLPMWFEIFNVREDYMAEIGYPDTSTPDATIAALEAMKANHPDKDGVYVNNISIFRYLFGLEFVWQQFTEIDGNLVSEIRAPEYKEMLEFAYTLAQKDLMPKSGFVNPADVNRQNFNSGNSIGIVWNFYEGFAFDGYDGRTAVGDTGTQQYSLDPWESYAFTFIPEPWMSVAFPEQSEKKDSAIKFFEYLASAEGQIDLAYGVEGEKDGWTGNLEEGPHFYFDETIENPIYPQGKPVLYPEFVDLRKADFNAAKEQSGMQKTQYFANYAVNNWDVWEWSGPNPRMQAYNEEVGQYIEFKPEYKVKIDSSSDLGIINKKVSDYKEDMEIKIIFAESDEEFESLYNELIAQCDALGLAQVEEEWTRQYQENIK